MSDVVILGAGPAGLALGCYLADAGISCRIVEKAHHPRPHVGESLMPAAVRIYREIGFLPVLEAAAFPHSSGVVYHPREGGEVRLGYDAFPQEGVGQGYTYHVDRSRHDLLLLKHAENLGCRIVQGVAAREIVFDASGRATGVRVALDRQDVTLPAKVVVDAAGRSTLLGRQLGLRTDRADLDQFALHGWFVGVERGRHGTEHCTHVYMLPEVHGWAWIAPIGPEISSIGVVASKARFQGTGLDVHQFFDRSLEWNEALGKATRRAEPINDLKGEVNYSYRLDHVCGDGWVAIGDAARFLDPIFSSGVSVALHGARFVAERIRTAIEANDFSLEVFAPYETDLFAGASVWDDFVALFYERLPTFPRMLESSAHRHAILRLIQGDVDPVAHAGVVEELRSVAEITDRPV
jgi:flavin-dependent dehydrogenase